MGLTMLNLSSKSLVGVGLFLFAVFVAVPALINLTGRWDFYFTLTSVALLAIASAGVWLTFYIGRINIGQGAFALIGAFGGYADEQLEFLGMSAIGNELASNLPQGNSRALGIAIGLATNPKVLLLDEPFARMNHDETMRMVDLV